MKKLRIGLVGAGGIVRTRHLPGLRALPDVEIVTVANSSPESTEKAAREFNIPERDKDWPTLVARPDLDIVWIGTPPVLHAGITVAALQANKHVFCQARMAASLAEAREMHRAAAAKPNLVTMICPPPHGMKCGRHFEKLLREKAAGDLFNFRLSALGSSGIDPKAPPHWRQRGELNGVNIMTVGIYMEVLNRWLGQPSSLVADKRVAYPQRGGVMITVPDIVNVQGRWPGNVLGVCEWSGVAAAPPGEQLEIYGSEGVLAYHFGTDEIFVAKRGEKTRRREPVPPAEESTWTVERDFIEAVRQGKRPEPSFDTGLLYMEVVEAIARSAETGERVTLPLHETAV